MGQWADPYRSRLHALASLALDIQSGMQLPFRLYGALIGAQLLGVGKPLHPRRRRTILYDAVASALAADQR